MLYGDGTGGFSASYGPAWSFESTAVRVADVNEDGQDDMMLVFSTGQVVFWTPGSATPPLQVAQIPGGDTRNNSHFVIADLNGDDDLDLAVTGWEQHVIILGNGDGTFGTPYAIDNIVFDFRGIDAGDVDGDGDVDVVDFSGRLNIVTVHYNDGNATTPGFTNVALPGVAFGTVRLGDYDGDGDLDIFTGASFWNNDGSGNFTQVTSTDAVSGQLLGLDDLNGDGLVDTIVATGIATGGQGVKVSIADPQSPGGFLPPVEYSTGPSQPREAVVGDFDEDGKADLAVVSSSGNQGSSHEIAIFLGDGTGSLQFTGNAPSLRHVTSVDAGNFD